MYQLTTCRDDWFWVVVRLHAVFVHFQKGFEIYLVVEAAWNTEGYSSVTVSLSHSVVTGFIHMGISRLAKFSEAKRKRIKTLNNINFLNLQWAVARHFLT